MPATQYPPDTGPFANLSEEEEDRLFGEGGFQNTVGQVAEIERQLGIEDLDQFTPHLGNGEQRTVDSRSRP